MTDSPTTPTVAAPPVAAPPAAPLAEGRWFWRRLYVFAVSLSLWVLLARAIRDTRPEALPRVTDGLMALLGLLLVLYLVAPSAQQLVELSARLRLRPGDRT